MKLLIDTNVIIYYLLSDAVHFNECKALIDRVIATEDCEIISASAVTDIFYIVNKQKKDSFSVQDAIKDLMQLIHVASVTESDIAYALDLHWEDFEDAVQYSVALSNGADVIISYNSKDFQNSSIPVKSPSDFVAEMSVNTANTD